MEFLSFCIGLTWIDHKKMPSSVVISDESWKINGKGISRLQSHLSQREGTAGNGSMEGMHYGMACVLWSPRTLPAHPSCLFYLFRSFFSLRVLNCVHLTIIVCLFVRKSILRMLHQFRSSDQSQRRLSTTAQKEERSCGSNQTVI